MSLLSLNSRCDANLVPAKDSRATEYTFIVEIARLRLHTTPVAFDGVALRLVAVPSTWAQRTRSSISHFRDVSILTVQRRSFLNLFQVLGSRPAWPYHPPARASISFEPPHLHSRGFQQNLFPICICYWPTSWRDSIFLHRRCHILGFDGTFTTNARNPSRMMCPSGIPNASRSRAYWQEWHRVPVSYSFDHGAIRCSSWSTNRVHYTHYPDRSTLHGANPDRP